MPKTTPYVTTREFDTRMKSLSAVVNNIDKKQDNQIERLIRLETRFDEGMLAGKKQTRQSASAWSAVVSGVVLAGYEVVKKVVFGHP